MADVRLVVGGLARDQQVGAAGLPPLLRGPIEDLLADGTRLLQVEAVSGPHFVAYGVLAPSFSVLAPCFCFFYYCFYFLLFAFCLLPFTICPLPFEMLALALCRLPFALCYLNGALVFCLLPFAVCHLKWFPLALVVARSAFCRWLLIGKNPGYQTPIHPDMRLPLPSARIFIISQTNGTVETGETGETLFYIAL